MRVHGLLRCCCACESVRRRSVADIRVFGVAARQALGRGGALCSCQLEKSDRGDKGDKCGKLCGRMLGKGGKFGKGGNLGKGGRLCKGGKLDKVGQLLKGGQLGDAFTLAVSFGQVVTGQRVEGRR